MLLLFFLMFLLVMVLLFRMVLRLLQLQNFFLQFLRNNHLVVNVLCHFLKHFRAWTLLIVSFPTSFAFSIVNVVFAVVTFIEKWTLLNVARLLGVPHCMLRNIIFRWKDRIWGFDRWLPTENSTCTLVLLDHEVSRQLWYIRLVEELGNIAWVWRSALNRH